MKCALLLLIFLTSAAHATIENPYFFEVVLNGKTSHIIGTQHIGIDIYELPPKVFQQLSTARTFLSEIIESPSEIQLWFTDYVTAIVNETAKYKREGQPLTSEEKNLLITKWQLPPKLVELVLSTSCEALSTVIFPTDHQMDIQFQRLAYRLGLTMKPLDTIELRERADTLDHRGQPCDIREDLKNLSPEEVKKQFADMNDVYRKGTETYVDEDTPGTELRNEAWISTLTEEFAKGGVFVDVGVGHLFGPGGILARLEARGATIRRNP